MLGQTNKNSNTFRNKDGLKYAGKRYDNPFFADRKKHRHGFRKIITLKVKLFTLLFLSLTALSLWVLFYSPLFTINNIEINNGEGIDPAEIRRVAENQINSGLIIILPQKNLLLFDSKKLIESLEKKFSFDSISITRRLPHTLAIDYQGKKYAFVWQEGDSYYYADTQGNIITEANVLEVGQKEYPLLENDSANRISDRRITVNASYLDFALRLYPLLKAQSDLDISRIVIDDEINTVKLKLMSGPEVYFNTTGDAEKQVNKFIIVKNEKLKTDFAKKTYIDVRFGDSVYYR